jgi:hypothetical protein
MFRIPHCLDNRFTDGGDVVSLKHQPRSTPYKHCSSVSGTHFCSGLIKPQGLVLPEGLIKLKNMYILADISGVTRVFIHPNLLSDKGTYTHSYISKYTKHIHKILIHIYIVIYVPSLVEIAPGVPRDMYVWCHLSPNSALTEDTEI